MENSSNTFVGLNKLKEFSCEIDKTSSEDTNCALKFKVENSESAEEEVDLSISRPGLQVLLDGLHKVQNQLSNVASKTKQGS